MFGQSSDERPPPVVAKRSAPCNGYLAHPFKKVAHWAFTARLFLVVKWG